MAEDDERAGAAPAGAAATGYEFLDEVSGVRSPNLAYTMAGIAAGVALRLHPTRDENGAAEERVAALAGDIPSDPAFGRAAVEQRWQYMTSALQPARKYVGQVQELERAAQRVQQFVLKASPGEAEGYQTIPGQTVYAPDFRAEARQQAQAIINEMRDGIRDEMEAVSAGNTPLLNAFPYIRDNVIPGAIIDMPEEAEQGLEAESQLYLNARATVRLMERAMSHDRGRRQSGNRLLAIPGVRRWMGADQEFMDVDALQPVQMADGTTRWYLNEDWVTAEIERMNDGRDEAFNRMCVEATDLMVDRLRQLAGFYREVVQGEVSATFGGRIPAGVNLAVEYQDNVAGEPFDADDAYLENLDRVTFSHPGAAGEREVLVGVNVTFGDGVHFPLPAAYHNASDRWGRDSLAKMNQLMTSLGASSRQQDAADLEVTFAADEGRITALLTQMGIGVAGMEEIRALREEQAELAAEQEAAMAAEAAMATQLEADAATARAAWDREYERIIRLEHDLSPLQQQLLDGVTDDNLKSRRGLLATAMAISARAQCPSNVMGGDLPPGLDVETVRDYSAERIAQLYPPAGQAPVAPSELAAAFTPQQREAIDRIIHARQEQGRALDPMVCASEAIRQGGFLDYVYHQRVAVAAGHFHHAAAALLTSDPAEAARRNAQITDEALVDAIRFLARERYGWPDEDGLAPARLTPFGDAEWLADIMRPHMADPETAFGPGWEDALANAYRTAAAAREATLDADASRAMLARAEADYLNAPYNRFGLEDAFRNGRTVADILAVAHYRQELDGFLASDHYRETMNGWVREHEARTGERPPLDLVQEQVCQTLAGFYRSVEARHAAQVSERDVEVEYERAMAAFRPSRRTPAPPPAPTAEATGERLMGNEYEQVLQYRSAMWQVLQNPLVATDGQLNAAGALAIVDTLAHEALPQFSDGVTFRDVQGWPDRAALPERQAHDVWIRYDHLRQAIAAVPGVAAETVEALEAYGHHRHLEDRDMVRIAAPLLHERAAALRQAQAAPLRPVPPAEDALPEERLYYQIAAVDALPEAERNILRYQGMGEVYPGMFSPAGAAVAQMAERLVYLNRTWVTGQVNGVAHSGLFNDEDVILDQLNPHALERDIAMLCPNPADRERYADAAMTLIQQRLVTVIGTAAEAQREPLWNHVVGDAASYLRNEQTQTLRLAAWNMWQMLPRTLAEQPADIPDADQWLAARDEMNRSLYTLRRIAGDEQAFREFARDMDGLGLPQELYQIAAEVVAEMDIADWARDFGEVRQSILDAVNQRQAPARPGTLPEIREVRGAQHPDVRNGGSHAAERFRMPRPASRGEGHVSAVNAEPPQPAGPAV